MIVQRFFNEGFQRGHEGAFRNFFLPQNRAAMACHLGAILVDDQREFGNWCAHGFALLEQQRKEVAILGRGPRPEALTASIDGDRIPMAQPMSEGPSPEQAARWRERFERHAAAGSYRAPDEFAAARYQQDPLPPPTDPRDVVAFVRDAVQRELASLRDQAYGANAMPMQAPPAAVPPLPTWPPQNIAPATPRLPMPPLGSGYMPGRRY